MGLSIVRWAHRAPAQLQSSREWENEKCRTMHYRPPGFNHLWILQDIRSRGVNQRLPLLGRAVLRARTTPLSWSSPNLTAETLKSVLMFIYSRRLKAGRWPDHGRWHKSEYWPFMRSSCPSPRNILLCSTKDQTWSLITYDRIFGGNSCMQRNFFSRKNWCLSKVGLSCLNRLWIWENL